MKIEMFNPDGISVPPTPVLQVARVKGASEYIFLSGQVPLDEAANLVGKGDFDLQCGVVYENIRSALASVDCTWSNVVSFTSYLTRSEDIPRFAEYRRKHFPQFFPDGNYPPNTLLVIDRLSREDYLLEVVATAAK